MPGINDTIASNLRQLRRQQGLSSFTLAALAEVPQPALEAIEASSTTADIGTLWKLATVLEVPFSSLISEEDGGPADGAVLQPATTPHVSSGDGRYTSRALFPLHGEHPVEFYEIRIAPGHTERSTAHALGTVEYLVVATGKADITVGDRRHRLSTGDALSFAADEGHIYHNPGETEAVLYLVLHYV